MPVTSLNWGILGTGNIAKAFARGLVGSRTGKLVAVGSRTQSSADAFGTQFNAPHRHGSYEALLADPDVQAVYISTPHPLHALWAIRAAEAGKHILCEKPIALNHAQAMAIVEAARAHGVFLMEAFMYRCHPQIAKAVELIRAGAIGRPRVIQASFGYCAPVNPDSRVFNNRLAGGAIMDVGCYPVSFARLIAGAAEGKPFLDPVQVLAAGHVGQTGVDEQASAILKFPSGLVADLSTSVRANLETLARVSGDAGWLQIPNPWIANREPGVAKIILKKNGQPQPEEIEVKTTVGLYGIEADHVADSLPDLQALPPAMTWDDTLGNMRVLDQWRAALGVVYHDELPENSPLPLHGRPLTAPANAPMKYGKIPGVEKPVSRLVMGCDNQLTFSHAAAMFDHFFEQGGNAFDTAHIYRKGLPEQLLGQWIKARNIRDRVVVVAKGAHTPNCNPAALASQLTESLDRLKLDYADIYLMHRDNPDIPVGEFIDALNGHLAAGRIKSFGGSNWSLARIDAANAYAAAHGKTGMSLVSNNFSLARMVDPVWAGCIAASDPDSRAWLTRTQTPLLAWSSQARGFFTELGAPERKEDPDMVRCWQAEDNFERRRRAMELAQKKGVLPINIALAYVLSQPFPAFALIGPRLMHETVTSLPGLGVELTPDELKWLNLEN